MAVNFDVCRYFNKGEVIKTEEEILKVDKIDVTGDGIEDQVIVAKTQVWACPDDTKKPIITRSLKEIGRPETGVSYLKDMKDRTFGKGDVVGVDGKKYVIVAVPQPQALQMNGDKFDRDRLIVMLIEVDSLRDVATKEYKDPKEAHKRLAEGSMMAELGELEISGKKATSSYDLKDGEKIKLTIRDLTGPHYVPLMNILHAIGIKRAGERAQAKEAK